MGNNEWASLAKRAGKKFEAAKKIASEGGSANPNVEDGRYIAQLLGFELQKSSAGRDQIKRSFKITEGESKGEKLTDYQGLDTDKGISFFMRDIKRLGYEEPESLEDCGPIVKEINEEQPMIRITVKNNGDFQNVFIDKALSADEVDEGTEEGAEVAGKGKDEKEEEEVEIEIGMTVVATVDGEEVTGKITKILESLGKVKIEDEDGNVHKVSVDEISLPKEEKKSSKKEDKETDLEDMDRDELEEFVEENDLDIDVNSKKLKDDDDLREAIEEAMSEKKDKDEDEDEDKKSSKKVTKKTGSLRK